MPEATDTLETRETDALEVNGTDVDESTGTDAQESTETVEETNTGEITPEEIEKLRKENNKLQMEINQRRNKEKELEELRQKAERDALEKDGKFAELAESLKEELAARTAADERQKTEAFRDGIIDSYGAEVAEKARKLNLYWDEASDFTSAEAQLRAKLDLLKGTEVTSTAKDDTQIHPNNPSSTDLMGSDFDSLDVDEQLKLLRKELGRAPQR